jgi:hypothetical protein
MSGRKKGEPPGKAADKAPRALPDVLVTLFCLAGVLGCLNFFRADLNRTLSRQNDQPVGTITFKYKAVQRRFADRVLWDRPQLESPVYNGDFIRTADLSEAAVTFTDDARIDMTENSMIRLFFGGGGVRIDLAQGGISVDAKETGQPFLVSSGENQVVLDAGGALKARREGDDAPLVLELTEGNAQVQTASGVREISAGPAFAVQENGLVEAETAPAFNPPRARIAAAPPQLISPAEGDVYRYRTKVPEMRYVWSGSAASYTLEAADNPGFDNPRLSIRVRGASGLLGNTVSLINSDLPAGRWYWRARPEYPGTEGQDPVQAVSFTIEQGGRPEAPVLTGPPEEARISIAGERGGAHFSWRREAEAVSYTVLISREADLSDPVLRAAVQGNVYTYGPQETALGEGLYYWGVYGTDGEGNDLPLSPIRSFRTFRDTVVQETVFPPDGYTVSDTLLPDMRFTWKTNLPYPVSVQISDTPDFSRFVINEPVPGTAFQGRRIEPGTYYWRIRAQADRAGGAVYETQAKRFTVAASLAPPELETLNQGGWVVIPRGEEAVFRWHPVEGADYYRFNLYRGTADLPAADQGGTLGEPAVSPVSGHTLVYTVPFTEEPSVVISMNAYDEGRYSWSVQAFTNEGAATSRRTGLQGTEAFYFRRTRSVILDYPGAGHEFPGLEAMRRPGSVRWLSMDKPARSRFILSRNPALSGTPVMDLIDPGETIALPPLTPGDYYWTVRASDGEGRDISAERPSWFRVLPVLIDPVILAHPRHGAEFAGLDALRRPETIRWEYPGRTRNVRFILSKNPDLSGNPLADVRDTGSGITLPPLAEGDYYWTVRAETEDGIDISAKTPFRFRVLPIPPLPPPEGLQPEENFTVGIAELREARPITFRWNRVSGANGYRFMLFHERDDGTRREILSAGPDEKTSYTLQDLSLLDAGRFVWQVEAVGRAGDGSLEQRGTVTENRFTVELPSMRREQLRSGETFYGQ